MPEKEGFFEILVKGHVEPRRAGWFEGFEITLLPEGVTMLYGRVTDQAALHAVLNKIRDLGLPLLSLNRKPDEE